MDSDRAPILQSHTLTPSRITVTSSTISTPSATSSSSFVFGASDVTPPTSEVRGFLYNPQVERSLRSGLLNSAPSPSSASSPNMGIYSSSAFIYERLSLSGAYNPSMPCGLPLSHPSSSFVHPSPVSDSFSFDQKNRFPGQVYQTASYNNHGRQLAIPPATSQPPQQQLQGSSSLLYKSQPFSSQMPFLNSSAGLLNQFMHQPMSYHASSTAQMITMRNPSSTLVAAKAGVVTKASSPNLSYSLFSSQVINPTTERDQSVVNQKVDRSLSGSSSSSSSLSGSTKFIFGSYTHVNNEHYSISTIKRDSVKNEHDSISAIRKDSVRSSSPMESKESTLNNPSSTSVTSSSSTLSTSSPSTISSSSLLSLTGDAAIRGLSARLQTKQQNLKKSGVVVDKSIAKSFVKPLKPKQVLPVALPPALSTYISTSIPSLSHSFSVKSSSPVTVLHDSYLDCITLVKSSSSPSSLSSSSSSSSSAFDWISIKVQFSPQMWVDILSAAKEISISPPSTVGEGDSQENGRDGESAVKVEDCASSENQASSSQVVTATAIASILSMHILCVARFEDGVAEPKIYDKSFATDASIDWRIQVRVLSSAINSEVLDKRIVVLELRRDSFPKSTNFCNRRFRLGFRYSKALVPLSLQASHSSSFSSTSRQSAELACKERIKMLTSSPVRSASASSSSSSLSSSSSSSSSSPTRPAISSPSSVNDFSWTHPVEIIEVTEEEFKGQSSRKFLSGTELGAIWPYPVGLLSPIVEQMDQLTKRLLLRISAVWEQTISKRNVRQIIATKSYDVPSFCLSSSSLPHVCSADNLSDIIDSNMWHAIYRDRIYESVHETYQVPPPVSASSKRSRKCDVTGWTTDHGTVYRSEGKMTTKKDDTSASVLPLRLRLPPIAAKFVKHLKSVLSPTEDFFMHMQMRMSVSLVSHDFKRVFEFATPQDKASATSKGSSSKPLNIDGDAMKLNERSVQKFTVIELVKQSKKNPSISLSLMSSECTSSSTIWIDNDDDLEVTLAIERNHLPLSSQHGDHPFRVFFAFYIGDSLPHDVKAQLAKDLTIDNELGLFTGGVETAASMRKCDYLTPYPLFLLDPSTLSTSAAPIDKGNNNHEKLLPGQMIDILGEFVAGWTDPFKVKETEPPSLFSAQEGDSVQTSSLSLSLSSSAKGLLKEKPPGSSRSWVSIPPACLSRTSLGIIETSWAASSGAAMNSHHLLVLDKKMTKRHDVLVRMFTPLTSSSSSTVSPIQSSSTTSSSTTSSTLTTPSTTTAITTRYSPRTKISKHEEYEKGEEKEKDEAKKAEKEVSLTFSTYKSLSQPTKVIEMSQTFVIIPGGSVKKDTPYSDIVKDLTPPLRYSTTYNPSSSSSSVTSSSSSTSASADKYKGPVIEEVKKEEKKEGDVINKADDALLNRAICDVSHVSQTMPPSSSSSSIPSSSTSRNLGSSNNNDYSMSSSYHGPMHPISGHQNQWNGGYNGSSLGVASTYSTVIKDVSLKRKLTIENKMRIRAEKRAKLLSERVSTNKLHQNVYAVGGSLLGPVGLIPSSSVGLMPSSSVGLMPSSSMQNWPHFSPRISRLDGATMSAGLLTPSSQDRSHQMMSLLQCAQDVKGTFNLDDKHISRDDADATVTSRTCRSALYDGNLDDPMRNEERLQGSSFVGDNEEEEEGEKDEDNVDFEEDDDNDDDVNDDDLASEGQDDDDDDGMRHHGFSRSRLRYKRDSSASSSASALASTPSTATVTPYQNQSVQLSFPPSSRVDDLLLLFSSTADGGPKK